MEGPNKKRICLDNFEDICRICLISGDLKPFNSLAVYSVFLDIKHLIQEEELEDKLPNNICRHCVKDLENVSTFLFRAKESEDVLKSFIKEKENLVILNVHSTNNYSETVVDSKCLPEKVTDRTNETREVLSQDSQECKVAKDVLKSDIKENLVFLDVHSTNDHSETVVDSKCPPEKVTDRINETREVLSQNTQECKVGVVDAAKKSNEQQPHSKRKYKRSFTCDYCGKLFERIFHLQEHINIHLGLKPFKCSTCGRGFAKRQTLTTHYCVHTGKKPFKCRLCGQSFLRHIGLSKHSLNVHNNSENVEKPTAVDVRKRSPLSSEKLARTFNCKFCNKQFSHRGSWIRHNVAHANNGKFRCSSCNWTGNSRKTLYVHLKDTHGQDKHKRAFLCSTCGNSFTTKGSLNVHMITHTRENFECNVCQQTFSSNNTLKSHLLSVHILRKNDEVIEVTSPFSCSTCGQEFSTQRWLTRHEKEHLDEKKDKKADKPEINKQEDKEPNQKKFLCTSCGKQFTFKCNLERHISVIHSGQKPFECSICGDKFTAKLSLDYHLNIHNDIKPYPCTHCSKAFRQPSSLKKHIVVHTGERRHKCDVCLMAFKTNSHLRAHMRRHM